MEMMMVFGMKEKVKDGGIGELIGVQIVLKMEMEYVFQMENHVIV